MISVLGAGAMGSLWAARLHPHCPVQVIDTRISNASTLTLRYQAPANSHFDNAEYTLPRQPASAANTASLLLVCTKSHAATHALSATLPHLPATTPIILFQNGLGSQQRILQRWPEAKLYGAITTEGAYREQKNTLIHAGLGQTFIGPLSQSANDTALQALVNSLAPSGLELQPTAHIWPKLWRKLTINCAINPFTALMRCRNGEVKHSALFKQLWPALRAELQQLLTLQNLHEEAAQLESVVFEVMENTAHNRSSMLQDIMANRQTEIDDINGFAARTLREAGYDGATNQQLWEQVHALGH